MALALITMLGTAAHIYITRVGYCLYCRCLISIFSDKLYALMQLNIQDKSKSFSHHDCNLYCSFTIYEDEI